MKCARFSRKQVCFLRFPIGNVPKCRLSRTPFNLVQLEVPLTLEQSFNQFYLGEDMLSSLSQSIRCIFQTIIFWSCNFLRLLDLVRSVLRQMKSVGYNVRITHSHQRFLHTYSGWKSLYHHLIPFFFMIQNRYILKMHMVFTLISLERLHCTKHFIFDSFCCAWEIVHFLGW